MVFVKVRICVVCLCVIPPIRTNLLKTYNYPDPVDIDIRLIPPNFFNAKPSVSFFTFFISFFSRNEILTNTPFTFPI